MKHPSNLYVRGLRDGIPIALGYLSVSFGFGIAAISQGLDFWTALFISMTNLTSAGQVAGLSILVSGGGAVEMILTQLVINLRYALMSLTLSQKLHASFRTHHRLIGAFGITDEVFALAAAFPGELRPSYLYGLITLPYLGWTGGTLLGAAMGNLLPRSVADALGIAIYGMFIAIVLPPAKKQRGIRAAALLSIALSCLFAYLPLFSFLTSGFSVVLCALGASLIAACFFPIPGENEEKEAGS